VSCLSDCHSKQKVENSSKRERVGEKTRMMLPTPVCAEKNKYMIEGPDVCRIDANVVENYPEEGCLTWMFVPIL
jgi:hypothetical protein